MESQCLCEPDFAPQEVALNCTFEFRLITVDSRRISYGIMECPGGSWTFNRKGMEMSGLRETRKFLIGVLCALLVTALLGPVSQANAQGVEFKKVTPDEALLDIDLSGRALRDIDSGYYANKIYVERWRFSDARIVFQKLSGNRYFTKKSFNEDRTLRRHCGETPAENCSQIELKQHSRRLVTLLYQRGNKDAVCAALDYVGQDRNRFAARPQIYGTYIVSVLTCVPSGEDPQDALAQGVDYLQAITKDDREIINLSGFDLPGLKDTASQ